MKKWQALGSAAALLAALLLGGCSGQQAAATPEQAATPSPAATAEPTPVPAPAGNPLTGLDDADYTGKRPVAVMLRTLDGAQPQWGIASADVLIEGVTEGNTAGLMALFADVDRISKVGPVGPGRDLFLQAALPLNAMPVSIDKNVYAANLLNTLAYQDLDGYHVGKTAFAFDQGRQDAGYREENCWYTTGELIRNGAASYGTALEGSNTPLFRFGTREEVAPENRSGMSLTVTFSKSDSEQLNYNTGTGLYEKLNADGSPMTDADNGQQAAFTNVFVLYASSGIKDDGYTRQYDMTGGTGLIMWMAELITDKGIGQGMSVLIFMSICSGFLPQLWEIGWGTNGTDGNWGKFAAVVGTLLVIKAITAKKHAGIFQEMAEADKALAK